jgi:transposase
MIPAGVQVFVALERVDMRCGFERLSGIVRERMGYEPRSGALFVFVGRRGQLVKIVFADATGACVFTKRLDAGVFSLPAAPAADASHVEIDEATLDALLDGLALTPSSEPSAPPKPRRARRPRVH